MVNPVRNTTQIRANTIVSNGVKKIFLAILSLILAQNFLFAASPLQAKTSELAINFNLLDLENQEISLSEFRGMPVILFFWTTWCPFCREELKQLNLIHRELSENDVQVLAINVEEPLDRVQKFIGSYSFPFRFLLDTEAKVAKAYRIIGVPTYIFINKEGRIVFVSNEFPQKEYKDLILK